MRESRKGRLTLQIACVNRPYGTLLLTLSPFPALKCRAIIFPSLRDGFGTAKPSLRLILNCSSTALLTPGS
jgi:hypothetical protein